MVSGYERHYTYRRRTERILHSPEVTHAVQCTPTSATIRQRELTVDYPVNINALLRKNF